MNYMRNQPAPDDGPEHERCDRCHDSTYPIVACRDGEDICESCEQKAQEEEENAPEHPLRETLELVEGYLSQRADVDDGVPDEAMRLLVQVRASLAQLGMP